MVVVVVDIASIALPATATAIIITTPSPNPHLHSHAPSTRASSRAARPGCFYMLTPSASAAEERRRPRPASAARLRRLRVGGLWICIWPFLAVADGAPQAQAQAWADVHGVLVRELRKMECVGAACERLVWRDVLAGMGWAVGWWSLR